MIAESGLEVDDQDVQKCSPTSYIVSLKDGSKFFLKDLGCEVDFKRLYIQIDLISHFSPQILKLCGSTQIQNVHCAVFEYCPGGNLAVKIERMHRTEELTWKEETVFGYMRMMVAAVKSLHENGFVHRRIEPGNFLIDVNNEVKLGGCKHAVKVTGAALAEVSRKERLWLGSCFLAMITLRNFGMLYKQSIDRQMEIMRRHTRISGEKLQNVTAAMLNGEYHPSLLIPEFSSPPRRSVRTRLPTTPPLNLGDQSPMFVNVRATFHRSNTTIPISHCSDCNSSGAKIILPCEHVFCCPCFTDYIQSLIARKTLSESDFTCKICKSRIDKEAFFEYVTDTTLIEGLDSCLLKAKMIVCPNKKCEEAIQVVDIAEPIQLTCSVCKTSFCSLCRGRPHTLGPCPKGKVKAKPLCTFYGLNRIKSRTVVERLIFPSFGAIYLV